MPLTDKIAYSFDEPINCTATYLFYTLLYGLNFIVFNSFNYPIKLQHGVCLLNYVCSSCCEYKIN